MKKYLILLSIIFVFAICAKKSGHPDNHGSDPEVENVESDIRLDSLMNYCYENGIFNGAILVSKNDEIIYRKAFGYANFKTKKKLKPESVFYLASLSKQFTAIAIMMLSERNKLTYNDKLSKYFPEFPKYASDITIKHLLTHTSGIFDCYKLNAYKPNLTNNEVLKLLIHQESLGFTPGDQFSYSNSGYILLAIIVEKVSGDPFHIFMKENIFEPLGMNNTLVFDESKPLIDNRAIGYNKYEDIDDYEILTTGDGGIFSTIDDLFIWDQALYTNAIVSSKTMDEAFAPTILNDGRISYYGFGWKLSKDANIKIVSHSGGLSGFRTFISRDIINRNTIILLTNNGDALEMEIIQSIQDVLDSSDVGLSIMR